MDEMNHFRVGDTLLLIHQSISRGVHMSSLYGRIFSRCGLPDGKIRPGFADYIRTLVSVLQAHHLGEDKLAFPRFQESLPDAPYEVLPLIGGQHDWAYILGPEQFDALGKAHAIAGAVKGCGLVMLLTGTLICAAGPFVERKRRAAELERAAVPPTSGGWAVIPPWEQDEGHA